MRRLRGDELGLRGRVRRGVGGLCAARGGPGAGRDRGHRAGGPQHRGRDRARGARGGPPRRRGDGRAARGPPDRPGAGGAVPPGPRRRRRRARRRVVRGRAAARDAGRPADVPGHAVRLSRPAPRGRASGSRGWTPIRWRRSARSRRSRTRRRSWRRRGVAWNAGMFLWRRGSIRAALERFAPDVAEAVAHGVASGDIGVRVRPDQPPLHRLRGDGARGGRGRGRDGRDGRRLDGRRDVVGPARRAGRGRDRRRRGRGRDGRRDARRRRRGRPRRPRACPRAWRGTLR